MRRFAALTILLALLLGVPWLSSPAQAKIGPVTVPLGVSNGYVLWENFVGRLSGWGYDDLAGVSFYWSDTQDVRYSRGGGVLFSTYTTQALQTLIAEGKHDLAYAIAQASFDKLQREKWHGTTYKLMYPLKFGSISRAAR